NNKRPTPRKRPLWIRLLLWAAGIIATLTILTVIVLGLAVWILTPDKLTPIVNRYASEYLDAEVEAKRVELTVWDTFPRLQLHVDSLTVVSESLRRLTVDDRMRLPAGADTVISIPRFSGGIDLAALTMGNIKLYDVEFHRPSINIVVFNDTISNIDIFPQSEPEPTPEPQHVSLPEITINSFTVTGTAPIRYISLADSIDCSAILRSTSLVNQGTPRYRISLHGLTSASIGSILPDTEIEAGIDGDIHWTPASPYIIGLHDFSIVFGPLHLSVDLDADITETPVIERFTARLHPTRIDSVVAAIPEPWRDRLGSIGGDIAITANMNLTAPFDMSTDTIPSFNAEIEIPDGRLTYDRLHLDRAGMKISALIDGRHLDSSVITLDRLAARGKSIDLQLSGTVTDPVSDPHIDGIFDGTVELSRLPRQLLDRLQVSVTGHIAGHTGFNFRLSDLTPRTFHRSRLNGSIRLTGFQALQPDSLNVTVHNAQLRFGTNNGFISDGNRVDSLLTVSIQADTTRIITPDINVGITGLKMGAGCRNTASSADTTSINPIGGTIRIDRLNMLSIADSSRISMRDLACGAALSRFKDQARVPRLAMKATARRLSYGDRTARIALRNSAFDIEANFNPPRISPRIKARYDSLAALHPDLPSDSIIAMMRPRRNRQATVDTSNAEFIDMTVDNFTARLLRRWEVTGNLTAESGRAFTPYFPLRNQFTGLDCRFNTDSIDFRHLRYTAGHSDFTVQGTVSDIRRALTSRRHAPIRIDFSMSSDTININELTQAAFKGAAFASRADSLLMSRMTSSDISDEAMQQTIETQSDELSGPVLVPMNISANFDMNARHIIYSDVLLHDFHGSLRVDNGAVNLHDLSASTDIGSASFNALYYAPRPADMMFGMGMKLNDFHIDKVIKIIPEIDTIMPLIKDFSGIIDADLAATTRIDSMMNFDMPTLKAALKLSGDSLVVLDRETFRTLSKWLMFKDKKTNMIDHMDVEMVVENSVMELYPFMFDMDRYRLGVMGSNDLSMNLDYHISVLKSPLPFKFGINIKGTADDMKIRLGGAKFKENMVGQRVTIADTTRINLIREIDKVFKRGTDAARLSPLELRRPAPTMPEPLSADTISAADSLIFIKEGLIQAPCDTIPEPSTTTSN
ncbi:MAG: hypothetical protein K2L49_05755, partial [Muribaculaceae bacterium]|nr:hypothetical protein [Muribaculaceae bacterium]